MQDRNSFDKIEFEYFAMLLVKYINVYSLQNRNSCEFFLRIELTCQDSFDRLIAYLLTYLFTQRYIDQIIQK